MRTDQMVGLNTRGQALTEGKKWERVQTFDGAWNEMQLGAYVTLIPGGMGIPTERTVHYIEFVQTAPWSSGPCYFLALKDAKGNVVEESLWTEKEIEEAL